MTLEDTCTLEVLFNGNRRAKVRAPKDASRDALVALAMETPEARRLLHEREVRRVIVVPGRLVNFVVQWPRPDHSRRDSVAEGMNDDEG